MFAYFSAAEQQARLFSSQMSPPPGPETLPGSTAPITEAGAVGGAEVVGTGGAEAPVVPTGVLKDTSNNSEYHFSKAIFCLHVSLSSKENALICRNLK